MKFWISIENGATGAKFGPGPITSAQFWENIPRLDRAGAFRFTMPATDPRAVLLRPRRVARCYALVGGVVTQVGMGIIDKIKVRVDGKGLAMLEASGDDALRALVGKHVGSLVIDDGAGNPDTSGPADIMAYASTYWALDTVTGYSSTIKAVLHTFEGETVLAAYVKLAELTGEHFRLGATNPGVGGYKVVWMRKDQPASGVRAVQGGDPLSLEENPDVCLITDLSEESDSYDAYIGRMYAYGAGNGASRINLSGASLPGAYTTAGYALGSDSKGHYLEHTATWSFQGTELYQVWPDIDNKSALVEAAYEHMRRRLEPQKFYQLSVAKLDRLIDVGSTIRVIYKKVVDDFVAVDIDADLVVLEATHRIDAGGLRTTGFQVATVDRWPDNDENAVLDEVSRAKAYYTHVQP